MLNQLRNVFYWLALSAVLFLGCTGERIVCAEGGQRAELGNGQVYCGYAVVIGGFRECSRDLPFRFDLPDLSGFVCSNRQIGSEAELPPQLCFASRCADGGADSAISDAAITDSATADSFTDGTVPQTTFLGSTPTRLTPPSTRSAFGFSVAISADGSRIVVGDRYGDQAPDGPGSVSVYTYVSGTWSAPVILANTPSGNTPSAGFGYDVAISGDGSRIVVGSYGGDAVSVYDFALGAWNAGIELTPPADADHFGKAVAISGDGLRIVAGDEEGGSGSGGAVYVYSFNGSEWTAGQTLNPPSGVRDFGDCVAIAGDGTRIVVGDQSGTPSRTVYDFGSGVWSSGTVLTAPIGTYDYIGCAISRDGLQIVINSDDYPAVVHSWSGLSWSAGVALLPDGARQNYSNSSDISGDGARVVVGDRGGDNGPEFRGAITVFTREGNTWRNLSFSNPNVFDDDGFGNDVAISANGSRVVVGAPTSEADGHGAVFVYDAR